jgi:hypothetical protein
MKNGGKLLVKVQRHVLSLSIIIIASFILVSDLFFIAGRGITFDGHIHMTTIAQFATALKDREFPVRWSNDFANFGLPLPIFAHQLPIYFGAGLELLLNNPVLSYNLVMLIAAITSTTAMYFLLKKFAKRYLSLIGAIIYNFGAYRIINIYIRGALPEFFVSTFIIITFIGLIGWLRDRQPSSIWLVSLGIIGTALVHPMMLLPSAILFFLLILYFGWPVSRHQPQLVLLVIVSLLSVGVASYYLFPLILEAKYFHFGQNHQVLVEDSFLSLSNYFDERWLYFFKHPGPRGDIVQLGLIESLLLFGGVLVAIIDYAKNKQFKVLQLLALISAVFLFFTFPVSLFIYRKISLLSQIQYPWRFLGLLSLFPPMFLILGLQQLSSSFEKPVNKIKVIGLLILAIVLIVRLPQIYTKNSATYNNSHFYFTQTNLHTQNLNTIWSDNSEHYSRKSRQYELLEGEAVIEVVELRNASRQYHIIAQSPIKMIDYTFYYPGWKVIANSQEIPIEFQDINYRGLITYSLPAGDYLVLVEYGQTKVRSLSWIATYISTGCLVILFFYRRNLKLLGEAI